MTTPDQSKGDRSRDEVLAGEYVLGVLDADQRRQVEKRMRRDRRFAEMVFRWEENLLQFNEDYVEEAPSDQVLNRIEERLFSDVMAGHSTSGRGFASLWHSLTFWRGLAFSALLLLIGLAGFELAGRMNSGPVPLIAEMKGDDNTLGLVASYDELSGAMLVTPVAANLEEPKSLEVWLIEGDGGPKSLGVLPQTGEGRISVPADMRPHLREGVSLAVSVEPFGGSPTGQVTGPVIAVGAAHF